MADYETNPILALWNLLPPEARRAYGSMARFAAELSPGAAFRDAGQENANMVQAAREGRWMDAAAGPAKMATAMAGIVPIARGAKVASKLDVPHVPAEARTATGWTFRDVKRPHGEMERGDWRRTTNAQAEDDVLNVELPIRSMYATQNYVNPDFMAPKGTNDLLPFVIKKNGNYYVQDGHHRLSAAAAAGKQTAPVRLVDLDGTTQTSFPLLERVPGLLNRLEN